MRRILLLLVLAVTVLSFGKTIVTTINPYYLIVFQLLGDTASVKLLVPPGANPHLFSLKPSDAKTLEEADLIVANGLGLETYLENTKKRQFSFQTSFQHFFSSTRTLTSGSILSSSNTTLFLDCTRFSSRNSRKNRVK